MLMFIWKCLWTIIGIIAACLNDYYFGSPLPNKFMQWIYIIGFWVVMLGWTASEIFLH